MADKERQQRVQIPLDDDTIRKIDEMAAKLGHTRASMTAMLVTSAVQDHGWIINNISVPIRKMADAWAKRPGSPVPNPEVKP